jgi:hypothetical protein
MRHFSISTRIGTPPAVVPVSAQELVGRRFFSDNLVISEPFVEDELSFPSILHIRRPGTAREPGTLVTQIGAEIKKRLTPTLELSVSGGLSHLNTVGVRAFLRLDLDEILPGLGRLAMAHRL